MSLGNIFAITVAVPTVTTAITAIQIKAGTKVPLELMRVLMSFSAFGEVSDTFEAIIVRKLAAATVTAFTPVKYSPTEKNPTADVGVTATGHTATDEGTDGDVLVREADNTLTGFEWLSGNLPGGRADERIIIPAKGIIGIKSNILITSATMHVTAVFKELA